MMNFFDTLRQKLSKPLLFALYGAIGCLIAALLAGELFLFITKLPPKMEKAPQAIVLLIDCSGSMNEFNKLQEVKTAATNFVQRQDLSKNPIAVVGFGDYAQIGTPLTSDQTTLENAIANLSDGGLTDMRLGLENAISQVENSDITRNILLFTDGLPNSVPDALNTAQLAKSNQINLIAVATGDADTNFLTQVTGDPNLIFYASSGNFDLAFQKAEEAIYSRQLVESDDSGNYGVVYGAFRIGGWTSLLALGTSLAIIIGQNHYLRRRLINSNELTTGIIGGLSAGLIAGALGQIIFQVLAEIPVLGTASQVIGWVILGVFVGGGMSFFVPNLKLNRALLGGAIGGLIGAIGFLTIGIILGDLAGHLIGAGIIGFFIGLMIAWIEEFSRDAYLIIHWNEQEKTNISLGKERITLGSASSSHIYLPESQGYHPKTAYICLENGEIIMQYASEYGDAKGMKKLSHKLENGDKRKLGNIPIEVKTN